MPTGKTSNPSSSASSRTSTDIRRTEKRDARLVRALCGWFRKSARDLPWRKLTQTGSRDPYHSLVSEIMLQQTQVSRVVEKFAPFIERFPTLESLAEAEEDDVLALWSGLGYYRRARSLHACAQEAAEEYGELPKRAQELESLTGIGRYTAGAIASIVHNEAAPIVDGNVERVLLRLEGQPMRKGEADTRDWCWNRAQELVDAATKSRAESTSPATFNEGLMELGALVCTPRNPGCLTCPLSKDCRAFGESRQNEIPLPKLRKTKKPLFLASILVRKGDTLLLTQRAKGGLWGGLWQVPTLETDAKPTKARIAGHFGVATTALIREDSFSRETTHRSVRVVVYRLSASATEGFVTGDGARWAHESETASLATGSLQDRVIRLGFQ